MGGGGLNVGGGDLTDLKPWNGSKVLLKLQLREMFVYYVCEHLITLGKLRWRTEYFD